MKELRQLVMRFVDREIDFPEFRRAFVERFLTTADSDPDNWKAIAEVESACADFSEGLLVDQDLRNCLRSKTASPLIIGDAQFYAVASSGTSSTTLPGSAVGSFGQSQISRETVFA